MIWNISEWTFPVFKAQVPLNWRMAIMTPSPEAGGKYTLIIALLNLLFPSIIYKGIPGKFLYALSELIF